MEERQYWINESKKLNIGYGTFYSRVYTLGWSYEQAATTPLSNRGRPTGSIKEYAVYRGDDLIVMGTATECAEFLGVKKHTIYWYASPSAENRVTRAIRLEDDDE